jgi:hypothetical protein
MNDLEPHFISMCVDLVIRANSVYGFDWNGRQRTNDVRA